MPRATKTATKTTDLGTLDMTGVPVEPTAPNYADTKIGDETPGFYQARGKDVPEYATEFSAGMDIRADLEPGDQVVGYNSSNQKITKTVRDVEGSKRLYIEAGERLLIPTGVHANIPQGFFIAIHARSGSSWKQGLILTNGVGVVDADYVEEIKVSLTNVSGTRVVIEDGERIAQLLLMPYAHPLTGQFARLTEKPKQKTSRAGGFGSTGVK